MLLPLLIIAATGPIKLAAPALNLNGVESSVGAVYVERFVQVLKTEGPFEVTTDSDIAAMLGIERQKQLLGCTDDTETCMAELAGALGVEGVIQGTLLKSEAGFIATLKVLDSKTGKQLAGASARVPDEAALLDWLDETAKVFGPALVTRLRPEISNGGPRLVPWMPAVAGLLLAGVGAGLLVAAQGPARRLQSEDFPSRPAIDAVATEGNTYERGSAVLFSLAGVAVLVTVLWLLLGSK